VPILPVVDAVAHAELALDAVVAHFPIKVDAQVEQEVIVAAVDEPSDAPEALQRVLIGLVDEIQRRMVVDGIGDVIQAVLGGSSGQTSSLALSSQALIA
jgi:hypothetical protein